MKTTILFLICLYVGAVCGQPSSSGPAAPDTVAANSLSVKKHDSTATTPAPLMIKPADKQSNKIQLVKRNFNYGQQIACALGIMFFAAFMMTSAQTWNPR